MSSHTNSASRIAITTLLRQARSRAASDRRLMKVIETVQNNLHCQLSLEELARAVNLSLSRLRHLFKEVTDVKLSQFIKLLRIEQAAYLLKTEFLTIKVVMDKVGINEESHFSRDFKAAYGMTPARYRNCNSGNMYSRRLTQIGNVAWI